MEVEYRKDLKHNYMVITEEELSKEPYCIRMLEKQALPGVIPLQQRHMDNKSLFYYDITGKQSMQNLFAKAALSHDKLRHLIINILRTIELAYEYLLPEDDFILTPEYIYLDVVTNAPYLCFLSGYRKDSKKQMSDLLEYLMNKVDYNDKEAVLLVYRLYAISKEEGYTFTHMYEVLPKLVKPENTAQVNTSHTEIKGHEEIQYNIDKDRVNNSIINIPVVMEKMDEEMEVSYYPRTTYVLTGICGVIGILILIFGFTSGILYNSYGERTEFGKLIGMLLVVLCVEGYLMRKLWSKENKLARIVTRTEYIDPRQEYISTDRDKKDVDDKKSVTGQVHTSQLTRREYALWKSFSDNSSMMPYTPQHSDTQQVTDSAAEEALTQEDYNPTCLLSDATTQSGETSGIMLKSVDEKQYASIDINEFPFFIGKLRKNVDFCLEKNVVSRYHAKITKEEDRYYISDLNSTNGTFVNDRMLATYEKKEIIHRDRVAFANLGFEFLVN